MRGCKQLLPSTPPVPSHQSLANMTSATVRISRLLSLPPEAFEMPLTTDPKLTVTISPPLAHSGPGPVLVRLISYDLREGQVGDTEPKSMTAPFPPVTAYICPPPHPVSLSTSLWWGEAQAGRPSLTHILLPHPPGQ